MPGELTVLYYAVGSDPRLVTVPGELEDLQRLVGGSIESVSLPDGLVLICNEEGKLDGLAPNRPVRGDMIVGNFFITAIKGEDFIDLTGQQISQALSLISSGVVEDQDGIPAWRLRGRVTNEIVRSLAEAETLETYEIAPDGTWLKCLLCNLTSHHPKDVANRYCVRCHIFHHPGGVLDYEERPSFTFPDYCYSCGAYLMGGATEHKPGCEILKLIREVLP